MRADPFALETSPLASDAGAVPFVSEFATLSRQAHIELVMQTHYFKAMHERAVAGAIAPLGLEGERKAEFYEWVKEKPARLQEALQRLTHMRDPSGFVKLGPSFAGITPGT